MTVLRTKALVYTVGTATHVLIDTLDQHAVARHAASLWPGAARELVDVEVRIGAEAMDTMPAPASDPVEGAPV